MSQQKPLQEQIIARAMKDEAFRQQLLSNPKAALKRILGITVPQDVTIMVYEDTPSRAADASVERSRGALVRCGAGASNRWRVQDNQANGISGGGSIPGMITG